MAERIKLIMMMIMMLISSFYIKHQPKQLILLMRGDKVLFPINATEKVDVSKM